MKILMFLYAVLHVLTLTRNKTCSHAALLTADLVQAKDGSNAQHSSVSKLVFRTIYIRSLADLHFFSYRCQSIKFLDQLTFQTSNYLSMISLVYVIEIAKSVQKS